VEYRNDGLPRIFFEGIKHDTYTGDRDKRDFSCTELLRTPKQFHLLQRHYDEIVIPASTHIFAMLGTALHYYLQSIDIPDTIQEERISTNINGQILDGALDIYWIKQQHLQDVKVTPVWSFVYKNQYPDWEKQLNTYAYLCRQEKKYLIKRLSIVALYRDWRPSELKKYLTYPEHNYDAIEFDVWDTEKVKKYLQDRIALMCSYKNDADDDIPICDIQDRWQKPDEWAIYKGKKRDRAVKVVHTTYDDAMKWVHDHPRPENKAQYEIIKRESIPLKCIEYCKVNKYCNFYKEYIENKGG